MGHVRPIPGSIMGLVTWETEAVRRAKSPLAMENGGYRGKVDENTPESVHAMASYELLRIARALEDARAVQDQRDAVLELPQPHHFPMSQTIHARNAIIECAK